MVKGRNRKVYLVSLMDDASRLIAHSAFCCGETAAELRVMDEIVKAELGRLLLKLEALQNARRQQALQAEAPAHPDLSEVDRQAALAWLKLPNLLERLLADFEDS
jgi:hypothetical protein